MKRVCLVTVTASLSLLGCCFILAGCDNASVPGSPGVPEPIAVLENPDTGERVRLFREIWFKQPKCYSEAAHVAQWKQSMSEQGFTVEIRPEIDRERLAELRAKNRARSGASPSSPGNRALN